MRTLSQIIDAAKDGCETTHEECLYALLAMCGLQWFDHQALMQLWQRPESNIISPEFQYSESFSRFKTALGKSPKEWLGWSNDPQNPDYQAFRKTAFKVFEKATGLKGKADGGKPEGGGRK